MNKLLLFQEGAYADFYTIFYAYATKGQNRIHLSSNKLSAYSDDFLFLPRKDAI